MKWTKRKPMYKYKESDTILEKVAKIRGIDNIEEFVSPSERHINDPYLIENLDRIAHRIIQGIHKNEKIAVSNDIDVDGLTSTAMMVRYLRYFTDNVYPLYHERSSGHGIEEQLDMIEDDTDLIVILDSSTNSVDACKQITERGIDVVIIDHHEFENENPYALIANPQMDGSPNKKLSAAALTYKCLQIMDDTLADDEMDANQFIDLVAVGLIADMMDMNVMENRALVYKGLQMNNVRNVGLNQIMNQTKINKYHYSTTDISFRIAPLLNGTARLDNIKLCLDLLLEDDPKECRKIIKQMMEMKEARDLREKELMEAYEAKIDLNDKILVVTDRNASKNFNGLLAQKIAQKYQRPAIVLREHDETCAGSFRSYGDFRLKTFLSKINMLNYCLGHEGAGGIEIKTGKLDVFKKVINEKLKGVNFERKLEYDLSLDAFEVTYELIADVEKFNRLANFTCPEVMFKVDNLSVYERSVIGKNKDTVVLDCDVKCIKFKVDDNWGSDLDCFDEVSVVGKLNINRWFNFRKRELIETPQIMIEEYSKSA